MSESMNAAQIASRKIKSAKGVRGKFGNRNISTSGGLGASSTQSFTNQDTSSGGGLFGGGLNASGTFNFSAPVQGISFGTSETSTPFWGSDAEEDRRPDTTAEEVERRNKPFRMVDGSAGVSSQPFSNTFQRTPLSALGQPNGLGSVPEAAKPNPFQVSRSQSPAVASFNFGANSGANSAQEQQPNSNIFSFGQTSQAAPVNNTFRFGTPPAVQDKPAGNIFSLNQPSTQAQPVSTSISFGSTTRTTTDKPASAVFSFGQTSSQPQQLPSSSSGFSTTPAPLNFFANSTASKSTPTTNLFGQTTQQSTSASNPFSNLNSQSATTNGTFGNQNQDSTTTSKSLFGGSAPSTAPTSNLFGNNNQQNAPANSIFGNLNRASVSSNNLFAVSQSKATPSNNVFGAQAEQAPTSATFGVQKEQPVNLFSTQQNGLVPTASTFSAPKDHATPAGNLFETRKEQTAPTKILFGSQQSQTGPTSSLFGGANVSNNPFDSQAGSNSGIFSNKPSTSTSTVFMNQAQQSTTPINFFANLNKPAAQVSNEPAGSTKESALQNTNGEFGASTTIGSAASLGFDLQNGNSINKSSLFSKLGSEPFQPTSSMSESAHEQEIESILPSIEVEGPLMDHDALSKLENETPKQPSTSNLFTSIKPLEAPKSPATRNFFDNSNVARSSTSPSKSSSNREAASVNGNSTAKGNELARLQNYFSEMGEVVDSVIEEKCPKHFTDAQKIQFFAAYRIRSLNKGIREYIEGAHGGADFSPAFHHYIQRREEILEACETGLSSLKRKHEEAHGEVEIQENSLRKRIKPSETTGATQHVPRKSSPLKTQPVLNNIHSDQPTSPEKRSRIEEKQPSMSPMKKVQTSINGSTTPKAPPPSKSLIPIQQQEAPPSPSQRGKRKAEVQINKDHPTEEEAIGASHSSKWHTPNESKPASATSGVFKSILDSSRQPASGSPGKMFSLTKTQSEDQPRFNPFASLPIPLADPKSPIGTSSTIQPSISSSGTANNIFKSKPSIQASSLSLSKPVDSGSTSSPSVKPLIDQASSNRFTSEANTQTSSLFAAELNSPSDNISGNPVPNLFGSKAVPNSSNISSNKPSTAISSIFNTKPASNSTVSNPSASKPPSAVAISTPSSDENVKSIKPPTFGAAPVNFLDQFGQKSKKSMADAEAEAMERAKEEDMESDEDEAEWEAKYKEKRAAEKKVTEELAKTKQATFVPGKGFTFDKPQSGPAAEKPVVKSIFNQTSTPFSSTSNLFAPINRSEASSPAAVSSRASSVFDGLGPPKPATFGGHNIFGHLSDVDSGADSGKGNDADDDTSDGESGNSNVQNDDEKNDPTHTSGADEISTQDTHEETGPVIASAKKPTTIFNFGSSNSGASTPSTSGGSLFDRISKDINGNPIRQINAENKENAGPGNASLFGAADGGNPFAKLGPKVTGEGNKSPRDNTWKPDSPIRFGASTTSPPTVSVTAPTPTKPTPFTGLFGSNAPSTPTETPFGVFGNNSSAKPSSPATFTGIFGNSGITKPGTGLFAHLSENKPAAVGFGFGSATGSSLLPSTAGSAATSRATSPGGTTDGESNNENIDPETEHHEQIDLTSGGPGEENEEVLHQVRAKALKFEPSKDTGGKNDWVVKGLGPLRVLKHKDTKSSRILLRADPSGTIVLNKGILGNVNYTATGKTVKLLTAGEGGQGLETWLLQVKTPAGAEELAGVLETNKRKD